METIIAGEAGLLVSGSLGLNEPVRWIYVFISAMLAGGLRGLSLGHIPDPQGMSPTGSSRPLTISFSDTNGCKFTTRLMMGKLEI